MIEFVILVWGLSLFLYALLAGADFGAGIIELFPIGVPKEERSHLIGKAMGPVWEANHIWLILALVITFNGFPDIFWFLSEYFHFPLGALAMGIIFRGASFTFMHYDPIKDGSQKFYHWIFGLSSIWCSVWIGIIIGSLMLGDFALTDTGTYERYFAHWLNPFALSMGIFITILMMFNASLFLYLETTDNKTKWRRLTIHILLAMIVTGLVTHGIFYTYNPERWKLFFLNHYSLMFIVVSFLLLFPQYYFIQKEMKNSSRIIAGAQVMLIMGAGFFPLFPYVVLFRDGTGLDLYVTQAQPAVIRMMVIALAAGVVLIIPGYLYLMKIFKSEK